jgi:hypothetical protein
VKRALLVALFVAGWVGCGRSGFDPCGPFADAPAADASASAHNIAFVTSTTHVPTTFGADLSGADATCNARAAEAGLPGSYVAWLSTSNTSAVQRLTGSRGWMRTDGAPFADRSGDIATGAVLHPLRVDEHGDIVSNAEAVHTGTRGDGGLAPNCSDYQDGGGSIYAGSPLATTLNWTADSTPICNTAGRLYCFGVGKNEPLVIEPAIGRRAFVTVQKFTPDLTDLAGADALCASEASIVGLTGTYSALLATNSATAISRFSLAGPNWVRLDGIPIADSPLAFASGQLRTTINVNSSGAYTYGLVYGGANSISTTAQTGGDNCAGWTQPGGVARAGATQFVTSFFFSTTDVPCAGQAPIYCLQQ